MKKSVLLLMAAGCWVFASAQTINTSKPRVVRAIGRPTIHPASETGVGSTAFKPSGKASGQSNKRRINPPKTAATTRIQCGSSYNLLGVTDASSSQLDANQDLGLITFAHREDMGKPNGSGAYEAAYSKDMGNTWDSNVTIFNGLTTRYPNGVILNPHGNTVDSLAYEIFIGPHTNGTTWDSNAMGSVQLSGVGTNINEQEYVQYPNISGESSYTNAIYMSACDDSTVHAIAPAYSLSAAGTGNLYAYYGAQMFDGTWSGTTKQVTWKQSNIRPHFMSSDGVTAPYDSDAELEQNVYAWSQDGKTGYVVFFGNLDTAAANAAFGTYQPVVYKTVNSGATWTMMPPHEFRNEPILGKYLRPTQDSGVTIPTWDINGDGVHAGHGVDATVDMNGNLHIFGAIQAAALANPDSAGYTFNGNISYYIVDVYTTSAGGWGAIMLDSLASPFGVETTGVYGTPWTYGGGLTWGARIQATRSKDGKKLFCTWLDDAFGLSGGGDSCIFNPVIMSIGVDVSTNMMTAPVQFDASGTDYWLQVSSKAIPSSCTSGSFWNIPCVVASNAETTNDGTSPVNLWYVQGVGFCDSAFNVPIPVDPNGINEIAAKAPFSVSPNFPNPFNKLTSFNVDLTSASNVAVDVYNMVGQKVWSMSPETMAPGTHLITINGSSFSPGVYFYKVTANGYAVTHKMVVE